PAETVPVTTARCSACGAAVLAGAPWCTLCYTDLRPREPEMLMAVQPEAPAPPVATHAARAMSPLDAPLALLEARPDDGVVDPPVLTHAEAVSTVNAGWPCHVCGTVVAFEHDHCTDCGSSFLAGADPT